MAIGNSEFSELLSATVQKIEKTLVDQVMTSHPTLDLFKKNVKSATGTSVIVPVAATLGSTTDIDCDTETDTHTYATATDSYTAATRTLVLTTCSTTRSTSRS